MELQGQSRQPAERAEPDLHRRDLWHGAASPAGLPRCTSTRQASWGRHIRPPSPPGGSGVALPASIGASEAALTQIVHQLQQQLQDQQATNADLRTLLARLEALSSVAPVDRQRTGCGQPTDCPGWPRTREAQ